MNTRLGVKMGNFEIYGHATAPLPPNEMHSIESLKSRSFPDSAGYLQGQSFFAKIKH